MAVVKTKALTMDRRKLLTITGAYGIGTTFLNPAALMAAGECEGILTDTSGVTANADPGRLFYWIDGMHLGSLSDLSSRANLTVYLNIQQTAQEYVESVVIVDSQKSTLAARYFDASMKMIGGQAPYACFENLVLDSSRDYTVFYNVRAGTVAKVYYATISKPELSRLNRSWLPSELVTDLSAFPVGGSSVPNPTPGLLTTPYHFYSDGTLTEHSARGRIVELGSDGKFKVSIDLMHNDVSATHYMRYFLVLDPVGRLLGYYKRKFQEGSASGNGGKWEVTQLTSEQRALTTEVADIRDCPWIQIVTDDCYDAVARSILRFA